MRVPLSIMGVLLLLPIGTKAQVIESQGCKVDAEIISLPPCAVLKKHGHVFIAQPFVHLFFPTKPEALAPVYLPDDGWAYIDRTGRVVVSDVATMDNSASEFHDGLVRVTRDHKRGLADTRGRIIVPLKYDGMLDYQAGFGWKACTECLTKTDGEHSWFEGGEWVVLQRGSNQTITASPLNSDP